MVLPSIWKFSINQPAIRFINEECNVAAITLHSFVVIEWACLLSIGSQLDLFLISIMHGITRPTVSADFLNSSVVTLNGSKSKTNSFNIFIWLGLRDPWTEHASRFCWRHGSVSSASISFCRSLCYEFKSKTNSFNILIWFGLREPWTEHALSLFWRHGSVSSASISFCRSLCCEFQRVAFIAGSLNPTLDWTTSVSKTLFRT